MCVGNMCSVVEEGKNCKCFHDHGGVSQRETCLFLHTLQIVFVRFGVQIEQYLRATCSSTVRFLRHLDCVFGTSLCVLVASHL